MTREGDERPHAHAHAHARSVNRALDIVWTHAHLSPCWSSISLSLSLSLSLSPSLPLSLSPLSALRALSRALVRSPRPRLCRVIPFFVLTPGIRIGASTQQHGMRRRDNTAHGTRTRAGRVYVRVLLQPSSAQRELTRTCHIYVRDMSSSPALYMSARLPFDVPTHVVFQCASSLSSHPSSYLETYRDTVTHQHTSTATSRQHARRRIRTRVQARVSSLHAWQLLLLSCDVPHVRCLPTCMWLTHVSHATDSVTSHLHTGEMDTSRVNIDGTHTYT